MLNPPRNLRELRRLQIISVARQIVSELGLEALTIGAIERRVDFSRGVISYHFRNKDEIVATVFEDAIEEINRATIEAVQAGLTPNQKLEALVRANVSGFLNHVEASRILMSFWGRITADPSVRAINAELYRCYRTSTSQLVAGLQAQGDYRADVDPDGAAGLVVGIVIGLVAQALFDEETFNLEAGTTAGVAAVVALLSPPV